MNDIKKKIEDNYLTFITIAVGSVAFISILAWLITVLVKSLKNKAE